MPDRYQGLRDELRERVTFRGGTFSFAPDSWAMAANPDTIAALLKERDALLDQHHRDSAELRRVCEARDEARADERTAMGYLAQVRRVVGGEDFPDMVRRVEAMAKAAP